MNKNNLKRYSRQARIDFINSVTQKAAIYGIGKNGIIPCEERGDFCFIGEKYFPKSIATQRAKLEEQVQQKGFEQTMEEIAYVWFNRFAAIRFMELKGYLSHGYRVMSHPAGGDDPEILEKAQYIERLDGLTKDEIIQLKLDGKNEELYQKLILAQCNELSQVMPFLFERINDYTEVLMPDHLLRNDSLIRKMVNEIPEEDWQSVEIIGWLYQFYISEKKDEVIGSKKAIKTEDIPAATQLFTPNWIVKYLVQNSLGAKWFATYPKSSIKQEMEYYIEPAEQTPQVQEEINRNTSSNLDPEEIKIMDPACGSGHMLVEAYNLLKSIYLERGYQRENVARLILEKNLFGLEIDERAAQLSGFALLMKARADNRNIFKKEINVNIIYLKSSKFININDTLRNLESIYSGQLTSLPSERYKSMGIADGPLFADKGMPEDKKDRANFILKYVKKILELFTEADTYGSLIRIPQDIAENLPAIQEELNNLKNSSNLIGNRAANIVLPYLEQVKFLCQKYDVVIANPPYMGNKNMNSLLKEFAKTQYPDTKSDLFAMFIERGFDMAKNITGYNAMVTMQSWMFLSSFEKCREKWIQSKTITTMAHLGPRAFSTISGEVVTVTAFTFLNNHIGSYKPTFLRLVNGEEEEKRKGIINRSSSFSHILQNDFKKIPGSPIAYWLSEKAIKIFEEGNPLSQFCKPTQGLATGNNDLFRRNWQEVSLTKASFHGYKSNKKWFPYNSGGEFRKWYGNQYYFINWEHNGNDLKNFKDSTGSLRSVLRNIGYYFRESVSWSKITSGGLAMRYFPEGFIFDVAGCSIFGEKEKLTHLLGFFNSPLKVPLIASISPTLNFEVGQIAKTPILEVDKNLFKQINDVVRKCINIAKTDWDSYETSWNFQQIPLLKPEIISKDIKLSNQNYRSQCQRMTDEMKQLEEENNQIFIDAYGLQDELTPEVPIDEITLFANPYYRYNGKLSDDEREIRFRTDSMKEFISYVIGCMMGRYSLDEPGLIYAHSRNEGFDPSRYQTFPVDEDGILPITDNGFFPDEVMTRLLQFIEKVWGRETLEQNLEFIAGALGMRNGETPRDTIRRYLINDFYSDHLKTYKKRPIYWLFSSGKEKAFQALVYLHRYHSGTLARLRTEYVIPYIGFINRQIENLEKDKGSAAASATVKIQKQISRLEKQREELFAFDEKLKNFADKKIELDLDDGVKINYGKFDNLLAQVKQVTGK